MQLLKSLFAVGALGIFALLPLSLAQRLGRMIGRRFIANSQGDMHRITRQNISLCYPQLSDAQQEALINESLLHTGMSITEAGMSWLWKPERTLKKVRNVHGESILTEAIAHEKGVIILAPHLGNWEVLNLYVSNKCPVTVMYRPPKLKMMDDLIKKMRARLGTNLAPADLSGVRKVIKALKKKEAVGILPDQEPAKGSGEFAPFFGVQAYTMKLFTQLVKQTKTTVVCGYALRLEGTDQFDIYFKAVHPDIYSDEPLTALSGLNASVEQCVAHAPAQYQGEYKRFNTRPAGESKIYAKQD